VRDNSSDSEKKNKLLLIGISEIKQCP